MYQTPMADIYPVCHPKCYCCLAKLHNTPWPRCISSFGSWCSRPSGRDLITPPLTHHFLPLSFCWLYLILHNTLSCRVRVWVHPSQASLLYLMKCKEAPYTFSINIDEKVFLKKLLNKANTFHVSLGKALKAMEVIIAWTNDNHGSSFRITLLPHVNTSLN